LAEKHAIPVLLVLESVVLSVSSSRVPPRTLLKPPIEVSVYSSFQILTPIQYAETFLGRKLIVETRYTAVVYLKEKATGQFFRVMESTITFMHIIEPHRELQNIVNKPANELPHEIVEQLIGVTLQNAIPMLVTLLEKHMVPVVLPISIRIECQQSGQGRREEQ